MALKRKVGLGCLERRQTVYIGTSPAACCLFLMDNRLAKHSMCYQRKQTYAHTYRRVVKVLALYMIVNTLVRTVVALWLGGARENQLLEGISEEQRGEKREW